MKNPFFDIFDSRCASLQREAMSWAETPFKPHGKVKRAGVDCIHFCAEVYKAVGLFPAYNFPAYGIDGGHHAKSSLVLNWLDKSEYFEKLDGVESYQTGDLLCFKIGGAVWHVGIFMYGKEFAHCMAHYGVMYSNIDDPTYKKRLVSIYRPMKGAA